MTRALSPETKFFFYCSQFYFHWIIRDIKQIHTFLKKINISEKKQKIKKKLQFWNLLLRKRSVESQHSFSFSRCEFTSILKKNSFAIWIVLGNSNLRHRFRYQIPVSIWNVKQRYTWCFLPSQIPQQTDSANQKVWAPKMYPPLVWNCFNSKNKGQIFACRVPYCQHYKFDYGYTIIESLEAKNWLIFYYFSSSKVNKDTGWLHQSFWLALYCGSSCKKKIDKCFYMIMNQDQCRANPFLSDKGTFELKQTTINVLQSP